MEKVIEELRKNREPIVDQCRGIFGEVESLLGEPETLTETLPKNVCERIVDVDGIDKCSSYVSPKAMWRLNRCPLENHLPREDTSKKGIQKVRVGQQKHKKKK